MPIEYSLVARGQTILCSEDASDGSVGLSTDAEKMLRNIPAGSSTKATYPGASHLFHVVTANSIVFLCATDLQFRKTRAYAYLEEIQRRFTSGSLAARAMSASMLELQREFGPILVSQMKKFSADNGDNITKLQAQVDEVKGVMTQNIEKVLEREEKLGDLIDKTGDLEASANSFRKTARAVHKVMWWKNMKMKIILGVVILVVLAVIVVIILFSTGAFKGNSNSTGTTAATPTTSKTG